MTPGRSATPSSSPGQAAGGGLTPAVTRLLAAPTGGRPVPPAVRARIEPHVGVDLSGARVLTGPRASVAAASIGARAFTSGSTIVLGRGQSPHDVRLMAHEATHVAQNAFSPSRCAGHGTVYRDVLDVLPSLPDLPDISVTDVIPQSVLDAITSAVRSLPGYMLLAQVTGTDPLTGEPVTADWQGVLDELLTYGPFGAAVGQALGALDALDGVVDVVTSTLGRYGLTFARIEADVDRAWSQFSVLGGIDGNLAIVEGVIDGILADVGRFVTDLVQQILAIVREAVVDLVEPLLTDDAALGPVWSLATKVFHYDPLRGVPVEAETIDILAAFMHLIGQDGALEQMRERGTLEATAQWLDAQFAAFLGLLDQATSLLSDAWDAIQPENLASLPETLPGLVQRELALVAGVGAFAGSVLAKVIELVKNSLLGMLSDHAYDIPGFRMISVIIGYNPFTLEPVPLTAETLIAGFITLLPGGEATYQELSASGVIPDAAARIESAMAELGITAELITGTFVGLWNTLSLEDLLDPIAAFERVVALFGDPLLRILRFVTVVVGVVVELVLRLMGFPVELLQHVISETMSAVEDIRNDPIGFLQNLVLALKQGFMSFFDNIGGYLVEGLVGWLFHGLGKIGVTIPQDLSFASILQLVLDVLGLSTEFLWRKLGEHLGEEKVAQIREALDTLGGVWDFIRDVQERGLIAIWERVQDQLSTLWTTILEMATTWILETLIVQGTIKLLTFLDPTFIMSIINGCIAFYQGVKATIEWINEILQIIDTVVSTIASIARGDVTPGAQLIERGLAEAVPVGIGFLAALIGIGNVPDKIAEIILSVRGVVEAAIDWLIEKALELGRAALEALSGGSSPPGTAGSPASGETGEVIGVKAIALQRLEGALQPGDTFEEVSAIVATIRSELAPDGLRSLELSAPRQDGSMDIVAEASPATNLLTLIPKVSESTSATVRSFVRLTLAPGDPVMGATTVQIPAEPSSEAIRAEIVARHGAAGLQEAGGQEIRIWEQVKADLTTLVDVEIPAGAGVDPLMEVRRAATRHVDDVGKRVKAGEGFRIEGRDYYLVRAADPNRPGDTHTGAVFAADQENQIDGLFWSRGSGDPKNSASHAETAFMNWYDSLASSIRDRVVHIQLQNDPYCPCWTCAGNLVGFLRPLKRRGTTGEISWSEAYERHETGGSRAGGWATETSLRDVAGVWDGPYGPYPSVSVGYERRWMG